MEKRNPLESKIVEGDRLLKPEELAKMMQTCLSFIYRETSRRKQGIETDLIPPHIKVGNNVRFLLSAVMDWFRRKQIGSAA